MGTYDGVDIEAVNRRLEDFVERARPVNASSGSHLTSRNVAQCGRREAIALAERIRPILDALYSDWRFDNPADKQFEFRQEYDAAQRLIARLASHEDTATMLGVRNNGPALAADGLHPLIWSAASAQWSTGHRHEAVLAGAKAVNSMLQAKVGRRDLSEARLVRECFGKGDPELGRPRLRFSTIQDEQTRDSMREGAMSFGAGCFLAIRNPVGHLPNDDVELDEQGALERLAALSLLARWIDQATLAD